MNEFLRSHCSSSAYMFELKAVCWQILANEEIQAGRDPDLLVATFHPTCPFGCKRPAQSLLEFVNSNFLPRPNKSSNATSTEAPYLPYNEAKALIDRGEPNAMDKYVPTLTVMEAKVKWIVPPINTKGAEIPSSTLCVFNNILTTVGCKNCGKPRLVYVVGGGAKLKGTDKDLVHEFLENQSSTYTCGTDFLEQAASINFLDNTAEKRKLIKGPTAHTFQHTLAI